MEKRRREGEANDPEGVARIVEAEVGGRYEEGAAETLTGAAEEEAKGCEDAKLLEPEPGPCRRPAEVDGRALPF